MTTGPKIIIIIVIYMIFDTIKVHPVPVRRSS